jgi:hypothetical protein
MLTSATSELMHRGWVNAGSCSRLYVDFGRTTRRKLRPGTVAMPVTHLRMLTRVKENKALTRVTSMSWHEFCTPAASETPNFSTHEGIGSDHACGSVTLGDTP